ncbi:two-component system QseEF-associated lipoprotein QseG [Sodalis sp.]|uniref:two-component system QseEF-associated lipoprotein QseG n=1 Tax=Sodalis sp. (in: enterobacteria) TaxID=1898979 RepID=UPI0038732259
MTGAARSSRQTPRYLSWHLSAVCRPRAAPVVLLAPLLLSACQQDGGRHRLLSEVPGSHTHLAPATLAQVCDDIWQRDDGVVNKPDYWLSLMECAPRMTPAQARAEAWRHQDASWQDSFRQSILLDAADIDMTERRRAYHRLLSYRDNFPAGIYPLFTLWRQHQALRLVLADERSRAQRQQQESDKQMRALTAREQQLKQELAATARKLQNLTDIELRLSSRKWQTPDDDGPAASDGGSGKPPSEERQTPKDDGTSALGGGANGTPAGAALAAPGGKPPSERQTAKSDGTSAPDGGAAPPAAAARPPVAAPEAGEPRQ